MAFAMLEYGITNQSPITVITGEIGAGKTTLIRHLLNKLDDRTTVGLVTNTHESFGDVLDWVMSAFDLDIREGGKADRFRRFTDFLVQVYARGKRVLLIIDEAQNMSSDALEEVRLLSNINADKNQVLQLILAGQPELRQKLQRPHLAQLVQRVAVAYHLEALSERDASSYVIHRVTSAGGPSDLFTDEALEQLYQASGGVPRVLNTLADIALVYGFACQARHIGADLVQDVVKDREQAGIFGRLPDDS